MNIVEAKLERTLSNGTELFGQNRVVEIRGLSTETKPTTGIGVGSTFLEVDHATGMKLFVFDGTTWHEQ